MRAKRVAVICSTDPRQDNRILKQVQVLMDLNYDVALFGVDSGVDIATYKLTGVSVFLYPRDIFPSWIRRIIRISRRVRGRSKVTSALSSVSEVQTCQDVAKKPSLIRDLKAICIDMRYLSYLYDAVSRDVAYFDPDIIHAHELPAAVAALKITKKLNCKFIYDAHEFETNREARLPDFSWAHRKQVEGGIMRRANGVITVSDMMSEAHAENYDIAKPLVVYNSPVDISPTSHGETPCDVKSYLGLSLSQKLAVYVGGFRPGRGVDIILDAVNAVPDLHLACVGISQNSPAAKHLIKSVHVKKLDLKLYFVAPRQPAELISFLSTADLSVVATEDSCLNHAYSMPNKLFESAFANVPLAVTPIAAAAGFVHDLKLGEVANSYDASDYAIAIRNVLSNTRQSYYTEDVKQTLEQLYSWPAQAEKIAKLYQDILE